MAEEEKEKQDLASKIAKFLPTVEKPTYKQTFNKKLVWTGIALILYVTLSYISVYGLKRTNYQQFTFLEVVMGSKFGSLMTLGIGPIVTAGILLQLLVGSKIINWDMSKPEGRSKFQTWDKLLAIILAFVEGAAYVLAGALPVTGGPVTIIFVVLQLAAGGIIVILLDELVSKWGFGSGISLFIAVGVGSTIFIRALSFFPSTCNPGVIASCMPSSGNPPSGLLWNFVSNIFSGATSTAVLSLLPLISTAIVFVIVIFVQDIRIDIPLAFSSLRGFGRTWSLKLLYTSNIPVILTAALIANLQLMGHMGVSPAANGMSCGLLGCFDASGNPASGIIYYLSSPRNLLGDIIVGTITSSEVLRAITYLTFMSVSAMVFSIFWVSTSGMDSGSVANQLQGVGMHIPGYRDDKNTMQSVLNKYIPALAVLGGLAVGLLAAFADFTGALGTGTGILLTTMIIYNYYEQLTSERLEEAHPIVRKILGEE